MTKPLLNDLDRVAGVNVLPFGYCRIKNTCNPDLFPQWDETQTDTYIEGRPGLIDDSILGCYCGGCITITDDGQGNVLNNSIMSMIARTYVISSGGDPQVSNTLPALFSAMGIECDKQIENTKKYINENIFNSDGQYANRSSKVKKEAADKIMEAKKNVKYVGDFCRQHGNTLTYGATALMDTGLALYKKGWAGVLNSEFGAAILADMAIAWTGIKITTMSSNWLKNRYDPTLLVNALTCFLVAQLVTVSVDGPITRGVNTLRNEIQGALQAIWDKPLPPEVIKETCKYVK
jgi:hypothetical protein